MNDLRQRGEHGRRGGIRPSHVLMQLVGAFVAVFYGLNRAWSYFNTLFLFADTVRSVSRKLYNAMSQNGRTGSRAAGQQTPPAEEEGEDDARAHRRHLDKHGVVVQLELLLHRHDVNLG